MVDNLDEAKATGENSIAADATVPAGGAVKKRPADKNVAADPKADEIEDDVTTPEGSNDVGMKEPVKKDTKAFKNGGIKEAVDGLFEGTELSEDFKSKTVTIFEGAVNERVASITEELQEKFDADLEEQASLIASDLIEKLDSYLDVVIEQWMEENTVAVESKIRTEVAESFMNGLKALVSEHNLHIEESTVDAVAEAKSELEEATSRYNDLYSDLVEARSEIEKLGRDLAFRELSEGLTDTQVERLRVLSEGVSSNNVAEYSSKVSTLKESFFVESTGNVADETEYLEEEVLSEEKADNLDPAISAYANALKRFAK